MWSEYFPNAEVHGFDLNDFSNVQITRCVIHRGDAGNLDDLRRVAEAGPFDIVIDDASHASIHQQVALGVLFDAVTPGGCYIVEDLHWQPSDLESAQTPKTSHVLDRLRATGRLLSPHITADSAASIEKSCDSIMMFDSLSPQNVLGGSGALAVMLKRI
jgi:hypothetical protein